MNWNTEGRKHLQERGCLLNRPDEVCYVPEYAAEDREDWRVSESSDGCFTHNSLLALCKGNEEVCQDLFYSLEWTYPTTLLKNGTRTAISMRSRAGMTVTIKWNGISWTEIQNHILGKNHGQDPEPILSLRAHLKGIFPEMERYGRKNSTTCFIASARSLMILPSRYAIPDTGETS